ncbi:hypothetical protein V1505DRAFT_351829 [Lipomyces doorenjongii]
MSGSGETSSSRLVSLHSSISTVMAPAINAAAMQTSSDAPTGSQSPKFDENALADDSQESEKASNSRKRRRIPVSCAICRQRKLKCNRMQPCSACIAHDTVPLCVYAVKPWLPGSQDPGLTIPGTQTFNILTPVSGYGQPISQNQVRGFQGDAPVAIISSQDTVSDPNSLLLRQTQTSSQIALDPAIATEYNELKLRMARLENLIQGMANPASSPPTIGRPPSRPTLPSVATPLRPPTAATATANPDSLSTYSPSLKPQIQIKKNRVAFLGPLSSLAVVTQDEYIQSLVGKGKKGVLTWKKMHKSHLEQGHRRGDKTKIPKPASEHSSRVKPGPELQAILQNLFDVNQNASQMFPRLVHRPICEFLITKYMQTINMVFPIVHPTVFREDMEKFWTNKLEAANNLNGTSAARKENMRGTALFAILLRLGRLALPVDWTPSQEGFNDSLAAFFGRDLKEFAWSCLRATNYTGKADFVVAQVLLGLRLELLLAPQGGDGPDLADSAGYIGIVCQIGLTMGLHRDPTSFPRVPPDMADAWRLLWLEMLEIDTDRALCINLPFALPLEMSDTQLDKIIGFPTAVAVNEQPSVNFLQAKTKLVLLTRLVLTRIMRPNFVISKGEFDQYSEELANFDERNLGSFQLLLEMIHADTDAAVQGPSDSYDLIQKYFLQLQFLRLQLVLLTAYSPRDMVEEEELRVQRIRCALKMLDTISTCMLRPRLFAGFMWLVVPIALRHHNFSLSLIARQLLKDLTEQPLIVEQERNQLVEDRWMVPDMAFKYHSDSIKDFKRLYQAFMKTSTWINSFADTYYYAYNSGLVLRVFSDSFKIHIISDHEKGSGRQEPNLASDGASTVETLTNDTPDSQLLDGMPDWSTMLGNFVLDDSIGDWWHDWSMSGDSGLHEQLESASGQAWNADNGNVTVHGNN